MIVVPSSSRRIKILRDDVSRKIAAGEVIDRPFSIVRELLDNAIDAGASSIDVHLEAGGISRVRVVDDGSGMTRGDLELCWQPHATSKIVSADDLLTVTSLGFRGEALSSMAVAARLEIVSAVGDESAANRVIVRGGKFLGIESCQGKRGTTVDVSELFFDFPARRKFLKGSSAESALCRTAFTDRALAHPRMAFRLFADGALKSFLPACGEPERIASAVGQGLDARALASGKADGAGFSVRVVAGDPEIRRRDRRLIQVFVNRRRVPEFSLIQAAEFGFAGYVPGGWYPVAFVFVEIDPSLVDFNIHPAKKEVRFRSLPEVHSAVVRAVRSILGGRVFSTVSAGKADSSPPDLSFTTRPDKSMGGKSEATGSMIAPGERLPKATPEGMPARFLGQVFGVFLIFELEDKLLFLDQHAAHEKLIFERLSRVGPPSLQELLIPLVFDVSEDEGAKIAGRMDGFAEIGVRIGQKTPCTFEITSLSVDFSLLPEADLIEAVKGSLDAGEEWKRDVRARAACRLAIKEGDPVDPVTAAELLRGALELPNPRCPHGRPIWHELPKSELYALVDRAL
jgi:DNA mismatch repair protein MutL